MRVLEQFVALDFYVSKIRLRSMLLMSFDWIALEKYIHEVMNDKIMNHDNWVIVFHIRFIFTNTEIPEESLNVKDTWSDHTRGIPYNWYHSCFRLNRLLQIVVRGNYRFISKAWKDSEKLLIEYLGADQKTFMILSWKQIIYCLSFIEQHQWDAMIGTILLFLINTS